MQFIPILHYSNGYVPSYSDLHLQL